MKIRDDHFLWKCYLRAFRGKPVEHPRSLCRFFWTAVVGLLMMACLDWNFTIVYPILLSIALGSLYVVISFWDILPEPVTVIVGLALLASSQMATLFPLFRYSHWVETLTGWKRTLGRLGPIALFISLLLLTPKSSEPVNWWSLLAQLLTGVLILLLTLGLNAFAGLVYLLTQHKGSLPESLKILLAVFRASKQKVCPPVEPPDSWQDGGRNPHGRPVQ